PFAQLRGDLYQLSDYIDPQSPTTGTYDTSFARGLALVGVTLASPWVNKPRGGPPVIEPIGQIIARQATVRQDNLPNEDAQRPVFDDTTLLQGTKFAGSNRLKNST